MRWYAGFLCFGKATTVVENVTRAVHNLNLAAVIPVLRVQKNPSKDGFYLFLGVESDIAGTLPRDTENLLQLKCLQTRINGSFNLDEIRKLAGAEMDVHDYSRIPYVALQQNPLEDPFVPVSMSDVLDSDQARTVEQSQRYDRLLLWLSAVGSGSWASFQAACHTLGLDSDNTRASQIARRMRLLGHLETSRDGSRWTSTPAVLAQVADDQNGQTYFLCGQRDESLLAALHEQATVTVIPQVGGNAPPTVQVTAGYSPKEWCGSRSLRKVELGSVLTAG